jgi:hypothetical protein
MYLKVDALNSSLINVGAWERWMKLDERIEGMISDHK